MTLHRIIALMASSVACSSVMGQTVDDFLVEKKLISPGGEYASFGLNVATSGEALLCGASNENSGTGCAYVFERNGVDTWAEAQRLTASDGQPGDQFGSSVAISGETLLIGKNGGFGDIGDVYVFDRDGAGDWREVQKLTASDGAEGDGFGHSVAISGETLLIGASEDHNGKELWSGSAYVFERNGVGVWTEVQTLTASDITSSGHFGVSVAISGETLLIGAYGANSDQEIFTGSAYIFGRNAKGEWAETQKLNASDAALNDYFGLSVAILGETLVIGADYSPGNASESGSAYVFNHDGVDLWTEAQKLTALDGQTGDGFGYSVAISGETVVVGASRVSSNGIDYSGSAYVFKRDAKGEWTETKKLIASDGAENDFFGTSVAISSKNILIGAPYVELNGANAGSAYVFDEENVINLDNGNQSYLTLQVALSEAIPGERLAVRSKAFDVDEIINSSSTPLTFIAVEPIVMGTDLMFLPADGTNFVDSGDVDAAGYSLAGKLFAPSAGTLIFSDLDVVADGQFKQNDAALLLNDALTTSAGDVYMLGEVFCEVVETGVSGVNRVAGDTRIYADYTNAGATIIQEGILYIYGDLVNTGTLSGEYNNGFTGGSAPEPGDGFNIGGSYTIGPDATLSMPNPVWWLRVGGNLDIAINDPSHFVMSQATIELNGLAPGTFQTLETLSADFGSDEAGFDQSNFSIGSLRITSDSTTHLVNNHVNMVAAPCEVFYIDELLVSAGATLQTNGCRIYARSATIDGTVDDPGNIIVVQDDCIGDIDGNGVVNGADLAALLGAWGTADPSTDLNGDGNVGGADLAMVLGAWGACP